MSGNRSLDEFGGAGAGDGPDGEGAAGQRTEEAEIADESDATVTTPADESADAEDARADTADANADVEEAHADADAATDPDDADATDRGDAADDSGAVRTDREGLDPPASTYVWSPGGGPCGACGVTAEERWRDGEDLVCADCKDW